MWQWTYRVLSKNPQKGTAVVQSQGMIHQPRTLGKEWIEACMEVAWQQNHSEKTIRLNALRQLQSLVREEIRNLEEWAPDAR
jgi:hypothetical protein